MSFLAYLQAGNTKEMVTLVTFSALWPMELQTPSHSLGLLLTKIFSPLPLSLQPLSLVESQTTLVFCNSTSEGWNQFFYFDIHKNWNRSSSQQLKNNGVLGWLVFGVDWWIISPFVKTGRVC